MSQRGLRLCATLVLAAGLWCPVWAQSASNKTSAPPPTAQEIIEATQKAETAHDIQRDFPGATAAERAIIRAAALRVEPEKPVEENETSWWEKMLGKSLLFIFEVIGWGLLTAFALGLIYFAATSSGVWQRAGRDTPAPDSTATPISVDAAAARDWLREAEAMALAGRYGEAVHFLLLRSFQDLALRAQNRLAPAWTSREILRDVPLAPPAFSALSTLVDTVERSEFAGRHIAAADFERCRTQYQNFVGGISA